MAISRRAVALVALAIPLVFIWPDRTTVGRWALLCAFIVIVDAWLAPNPRQLRIVREPITPIRVGEETESVISITLPEHARGRSGDAGAYGGAGADGGGDLSADPPPGTDRPGGDLPDGDRQGRAIPHPADSNAPTAEDLQNSHQPRTRAQSNHAKTALKRGKPNPRPRLSGRWKAVMIDVRDAWPWSAHATENRHRMRARDVVEDGWVVRTELRPSRRALVKSDQITVRSWGPLRLGARQLSLRCEQTLRVLPAFPSRKYLPRALTKLQHIEGHALALRPGQGTEFDSLREWVDGDDVRSIDWRASARSDDKLIVRTWRPERDRHVVMLLDTSRLSAVRLGETARLDVNMDAILLLSAVAAKAQDSVSLIAGDRVIHRDLRRPETRNILQTLSHAMVGLEPAMVEADWVHLARTVLAMRNKTSLLVLFTAVDPAPLRESLLPVLATLAPQMRVLIASASEVEAAGGASGVAGAAGTAHGAAGTAHGAAAKASVAGGSSGSDAKRAGQDSALSEVERVYHWAAAAQLDEQKARAADALTTVSVDVIQAPPGELAMAVVEHYLALKSRGQL